MTIDWELWVGGALLVLGVVVAGARLFRARPCGVDPFASDIGRLISALGGIRGVASRRRGAAFRSADLVTLEARLLVRATVRSRSGTAGSAV
jgi:hypothetical protein